MALDKEASLTALGVAVGTHVGQNAITHKMLKDPGTYEKAFNSFVRGAKKVGEGTGRGVADSSKNLFLGGVAPDINIMHRIAHDMGSKDGSKVQGLLLARAMQGKDEKVKKLLNHKRVQRVLDKVKEKTGLPAHDMMKNPEFIRKYVNSSNHPIAKAISNASKRVSDKVSKHGEKALFLGRSGSIHPHRGVELASLGIAAAGEPLSAAIGGAKALASSRMAEKVGPIKKFKQVMEKHFIEDAFKGGVQKGLEGKERNKYVSKIMSYGVNPTSEHLHTLGRDIGSAWRKHTQG